MNNKKLLNQKDSMGRTLVMIAIRNNQTEILEYLLSKGANPNYKDYYNINPLHWTITSMLSFWSNEQFVKINLEMTEILLKHGAIVRDDDDCDTESLIEYWGQDDGNISGSDKAKHDIMQKVKKLIGKYEHSK